jgi:hypothetical protein
VIIGSFFSYGNQLMADCATTFQDFAPANDGQIFWESIGINFIGVANWNGCYGESFE